MLPARLLDVTLPLAAPLGDAPSGGTCEEWRVHDHGPAERGTSERVARQSGRFAAGRRAPGPVDALALQRTAGNAAVVRLLGRGVPASGDVVVQRGRKSQGKRNKGKEKETEKKSKKRDQQRKGDSRIVGAKGKEEVTDDLRTPDDVERVPEYPDNLTQAEIQKRMHYACLLLDAKRNSGSAAAELSAWFGPSWRNGLCGGWVTVHRRRPDWLLSLWTSLSAWRLEGDKDTLKLNDLDLLNDELRKRLVESNQGREADEVLQALIAAWGEMDEKEPAANYGRPPDALLGLVGEPVMSDDWRLTEKFELSIRIAEAGPEVGSLVRKHAAKGATKLEYYFHVETEHHHFGVHMAKGRWTVCEPERFGLAQIEEADLGQVLGSGFLTGYSPKNDDGSVSSHPPEPLIKPAAQLDIMSSKELSDYHKEVAGRRVAINDWRAERNRLKIKFEVTVYTHPVRR